MVEYQRPRETITIIERDEAGRERKVTATRGHPNQPGHWDIVGEEPHGEKWTESINGSRGIVTLKMQNKLDDNRNDFNQARERGYRPRQRMLFDRNIAVSEADPQFPITKR
jgi:hypothetical protein